LTGFSRVASARRFRSSLRVCSRRHTDRHRDVATILSCGHAVPEQVSAVGIPCDLLPLGNADSQMRLAYVSRFHLMRATCPVIERYRTWDHSLKKGGGPPFATHNRAMDRGPDATSAGRRPHSAVDKVTVRVTTPSGTKDNTAVRRPVRMFFCAESASCGNCAALLRGAEMPLRS